MSLCEKEVNVNSSTPFSCVLCALCFVYVCVCVCVCVCALTEKRRWRVKEEKEETINKVARWIWSIRTAGL